jgi:hypothetical protein
MNSQGDFLKCLIAFFEKSTIPYMISGSVASSFHGEPRATNDVDIVIVVTKSQLHEFVQSLGKEYYVSAVAAENALRHNSMFNVIDIKTGWKADIIIRRPRPFSEEEFCRRCTVEMMGQKVWVLSPEDAIVSKLEWSKDRESERQLQDAVGVAFVQWERLDRAYLQKWAKQLHIEELLQKVLSKAQLLRSTSK